MIGQRCCSVQEKLIYDRGVGMIDAQEYENLRQNIQDMVKSGYEVMLFHQGFGETVTFLQLLYKYKELTGKKLFIFTKVSTRTELMQSCPYVDDMIEISEELYDMLATDYELRIFCRIRNVLELHEIVGIDKSDIHTQMCDYLQIPGDTPFRPYCMPEIDCNWDEYFDAKGLIPGNSVYLVPHAVFFGKVVPDDFWLTLVERLRQKGYTPIMNLPTETIPGVPYAYFDIFVSLQLAQRCGHVVGVRTGFMDLAAVFIDSDLQIIYPDDTNPSWKLCEEYTWHEKIEENYFEKYMEGWGVKKLFRREGRENIEEFVYTNTDDTVDYIISHL